MNANIVVITFDINIIENISSENHAAFLLLFFLKNKTLRLFILNPILTIFKSRIQKKAFEKIDIW
jgi:hypothetical protein